MDVMVTRFPEELLTQSREVRYRYFNDLIIMHPQLMEAYDTIWDALHDPQSPALVNLFGPSGVGKTTLLLWIKQTLLQEAYPDLLANPGRIPFVALDAIPPETTTYDWNDFLIRSLSLLQEPLIEEKEVPYVQMSGQRRTVRHYLRNDVMSPLLFRALEQSLRYREVSTFIVDDATYLGVMYWKGRLIEHFHKNRELFERTGTSYLFAGTYKLLELIQKMNLAGWKSIDVYLPHYQLGLSQDLLSFQSILWTLQRHVPIHTEPNFISYLDYLYSGSAGSIGMLKGWLSRSLAAALEAGANTITLRELERFKWPTWRLKQLLDEITQGEEALIQHTSQGNTDTKKSHTQGANPPKRSNHRVGHRKPIRDRVGQ